MRGINWDKDRCAVHPRRTPGFNKYSKLRKAVGYRRAINALEGRDLEEAREGIRYEQFIAKQRRKSCSVVTAALQ